MTTQTINLDGCNVSAALLEACFNAMAKGKPILLVGAPGSGKTMLARRLGAIRGGPFRAPHHTVSVIGMMGNHQHPYGGECALANKGTLFLDELPEFPRATLEGIRVAYLEKEISRYDREGERNYGVGTDFYLIAAGNACPCGWRGTSRKCECSGDMRARYFARVQSFTSAVDFVRIGVASVTGDDGRPVMIREPAHDPTF